jgi:predicted RNase H-like HicB family nuclease
MKSIRVIVEQHSDGYVAYPLNMKGVVVGQGDTAEEALADVQSAIRFHVETFGTEVLKPDSEVLDAFLCETDVAT